MKHVQVYFYIFVMCPLAVFVFYSTVVHTSLLSNIPLFILWLVPPLAVASHKQAVSGRFRSQEVLASVHIRVMLRLLLQTRRWDPCLSSSTSMGNLMSGTPGTHMTAASSRATDTSWS
jgi:hypothetical protein